MSIAFLSDVHLHKWTEFATYSKEGVNERLEDGARVFDKVAVHCGLRPPGSGIYHLIIAGDLFHRKGMIDVEVLEVAAKGLQTCLDRGISVYLLTGNHDLSRKSGATHSLKAFKAFSALLSKGLHIIDTPTTMVIDGCLVDFIPYFDSAKLFVKTVKELQVRESGVMKRLGVFHHGFKGATVGGAIEYVVKEPIDPLPIAKMYDYAFSGHYHKQQWLADNFMYIGSPMHHTRSDRGVKGKGFIVYNPVTNLAMNMSLGMPEFVVYKKGGPGVGAFGNFVDVVGANAREIDGIVKMLREGGARAIQAFPVAESAVETATRSSITPAMGERQAMKRYARWAVDEGKTEYSREELVEVGRNILSKVM